MKFSHAWALLWLSLAGGAALMALFLPGAAHSLVVAGVCALVGLVGAWWFR